MSVLFKTNLRRKLLAYFFTHPDKNFYVRELANLVDEDAGNLSRELRKLEEEGLFNSYVRGKLRIYSLNKAYPLFNELKQIVFKTDGIEGSLRNLVHKCRGISLAFIYGSYAKNKENEASDIDLVLVGKFPQNEFTRQIRKLESKLGREINVTFYNKEEFDKERKKEGGFLRLVLKDKISPLKGEINGG